MKAELIHDGDYVKGCYIEAMPVETLILNQALAQYAANRDNHATDRLIALQMGRALMERKEQ